MNFLTKILLMVVLFLVFTVLKAIIQSNFPGIPSEDFSYCKGALMGISYAVLFLGDDKKKKA